MTELVDVKWKDLGLAIDLLDFACGVSGSNTSKGHVGEGLERAGPVLVEVREQAGQEGVVHRLV